MKKKEKGIYSKCIDCGRSICRTSKRCCSCENKSRRKEKNKCIDCGKNILRNSKRCCSCKDKSRHKEPNKCVDCGKKLRNRNNKRCRSCYDKFNIGKNSPLWKEKVKCIDCGKEISRKAIRCVSCTGKYFSGKNSWFWKGKEKPKCIDCGKEIRGCFAKRCKSCYGKSVCGENSPHWIGKPKCIDCGKQLKKWGAKRCRSCSSKVMGKNELGERNPSWKGGKPKCIDCGKQLLAYGQKRCRSCHAKSVSGENSPLWIDGRSFKPYPLGWNKTFKEQIRYRDNYICQLCGVPEVECSRRLHVHHLDYNKGNLKEDNLLSLCMSCHMKTNRNREFWIKFFSKIIRRNIGLTSKILKT